MWKYGKSLVYLGLIATTTIRERFKYVFTLVFSFTNAQIDNCISFAFEKMKCVYVCHSYIYSVLYIGINSFLKVLKLQITAQSSVIWNYYF